MASLTLYGSGVADTTLTTACKMATVSGGVEIKSPPMGNGIVSATNNNQLWIDATVATTLTGFVYGMQE